ncbi:hypothetical protein [Mycobacterium sp. E342]|uniref:hypothetical protein n=1 Tax=Mycobacterium sp. E342 TaxID=1834147 RepID=UPI0012EAAA6D|nr:hypothetical protein [Mycobacterium sp. E342]
MKTTAKLAAAVHRHTRSGVRRLWLAAAGVWLLGAALLFTLLGSGLLTAPSTRATVTVFTMCPDGHEGVAGGHTSCPFARNVHDKFTAGGLHFLAYSPTTDQWYEVFCDPTKRPAYFENGMVVDSWNCYAGDNAEVVVW